MNTYTWTEKNELETVTTPSGTWSYTYDPFGTRLTTTTGALTYLHQDHLGGIALATDEDGLVVQLYDTHPYGTTLLEEDYDPSSETPYSFTGKEYTEDTGLFYFEARWYDPLIGRFVSSDPMALKMAPKLIKEPQKLNAYTYSGNNPTNLIEPPEGNCGKLRACQKPPHRNAPPP